MTVKKKRKNQVISYITMKKTLGGLTIAMPFLLVFCSQINGRTPLLETISGYYFTNARDLFVGLLCIFAIFLITYQGYDLIDEIICNFAGFLSLAIAFFPAVSEKFGATNYIFRPLGVTVISNIHYTVSALFFFTLAFITFFLFTRTSPQEDVTESKLLRNKIYYICGSIIFFTTTFSILCNIIPENIKSAICFIRPIFMLESAGLIAFGIAWLIKAEAFLKDEC